MGLAVFHKIFPTSNLNMRIFCGISPIAHNTVINMNNVMFYQNIHQYYKIVDAIITKL